MVAKRNDMKDLIDEAIDASIDFEELMDKTDFDSWLEGEDPDNSVKLKSQGQKIAPFTTYKTNKNKLEKICRKMKGKGSDELPKSGDKSSLEKYLIFKLFHAKIKRVEARISFQKKDWVPKYEEALYSLLSALNQLQLPNRNNIDRKWLILLYNDLSISYAGLENSSMSRGYAQEARWIIENKEESYANKYKLFYQKFNADEPAIISDIVNHDFVSTRLYDLHTIAVYNQAVAEHRSHYYSDAEKNFKRIIDKVKKNDYKGTDLRNFNYYSALLNLSDLYITLGRGKEAIELLDKALENKDELDDNDIRYWDVILAKINALIDQTDYDDARDLLNEDIFENGNEYSLSNKHKITSTGFKGFNCMVRCLIEDATNELMAVNQKMKNELKKAAKVIEDRIEIMSKRIQDGYKIKAYRQLSEIYIILRQNENVKKTISEYDKQVMNYLVKFISEKDIIDDPKTFIKSNKDMGKWINRCDDLDALEDFIGQIIKIIKDEPDEKYRDLLKEINKKITKECEDKDQLHRAERIGKQTEKILGEKKDQKYMENFFKGKLENVFPEESPNGKENLTRKEICERLDLNELDFDSGFFDRSEMKEQHLVEVIVLRRWNSFSPGLYKESTGSLGGGYLLRIKRDRFKDSDVENIVIDPGYNFIQSFRSEGFHVEDIDTIIITHSHLDHCAELLQIMDLLFQFNKRYTDTPYKKRQRKRVNLYLSKGAYTKFSSFTNESWQKQLQNVIICENLDDNKCESFKGLTISAIPTPHMDLGGVNAIGLKIEIDSGKEKLCLGFTGDTPWSKKIRDKFKGCDFLCIHLGSIKYHEIGYSNDRYNLRVMKKPRKIKKIEDQLKEFDKKYGGVNHLSFFGTLDFIEHCSDRDGQLVIIGEFGEELKYGLRTDLCRKLREEVNDNRKKEEEKIVCLPGDIGLYIGVMKDGTKKIRCCFCEMFIEPKEIDTFSYGREDAIHYICKTCDDTLTNLQKQAVIEHKVTRH